MSETRRLCDVPSEREGFPSLDPGLVCDAHSGHGVETGLGHEIENGSTLRQNGIEPDKKSFGEAFGAATGVSDPRLQ